MRPPDLDIACMGGFACPNRAACRRYHSENRSEPSERVCSKGTFDAWVPIAAEESSMAYDMVRDPQRGAAVKELLARAEGVTAGELAEAIACSYTAAYSVLRRWHERSELVLRKGFEGGTLVARYWTDQGQAEAYVFESPLRSDRRRDIRGHLEANGGMTPAEIAPLIGWTLKPTLAECLRMLATGEICREEDLNADGYITYRYFANRAAADAWLGQPGNRVEDKIAARGGEIRGAKLESVRERDRIRQQQKADVAGKACPKVSGRSDEARRANEIARKMVAKKRVDGTRRAPLPPAQQPGSPVITERTKITRAITPLGRYEVAGRVIGGFGTKRIGEYDQPASTWAEAACV